MGVEEREVKFGSEFECDRDGEVGEQIQCRRAVFKNWATREV